MDATLSTEVAGLRVNPGTCFTDAKGKQSRPLEKHRRKLLGKIAPFTAKVLEEGEEVHFVTEICSPFSFLELLTTGYLIQNVRAAVLVVTDRRFLHLPTTGARKPRGSVSEVRFGDVEGAKVTGLLSGKLVLEYRGGGKETFTGVPWLAIKQLRALVAARAGRGPATAAGGRRFLCPSCKGVLENEPGSCAACGMEFRSRRKALKLSLLVPGGGYFYTGHPVMGVADGLIEAFLLLFVVAGAGFAFAGEPDMLAGTAIFAAALAVEKLITVYHASHYVREHLPVDRKRALAPARAERAAIPIAP